MPTSVCSMCQARVTRGGSPGAIWNQQECPSLRIVLRAKRLQRSGKRTHVPVCLQPPHPRPPSKADAPADDVTAEPGCLPGARTQPSHHFPPPSLNLNSQEWNLHFTCANYPPALRGCGSVISGSCGCRQGRGGVWTAPSPGRGGFVVPYDDLRQYKRQEVIF